MKLTDIPDAQYAAAWSALVEAEIEFGNNGAMAQEHGIFEDEMEYLIDLIRRRYWRRLATIKTKAEAIALIIEVNNRRLERNAT